MDLYVLLWVLLYFLLAGGFFLSVYTGQPRTVIVFLLSFVAVVFIGTGFDDYSEEVASGYPADPCVLQGGELYEVEFLSQDLLEGVWLRIPGVGEDEFMTSDVRLVSTASDVFQSNEIFAGATHVKVERNEDGCRLVPWKNLYLDD